MVPAMFWSNESSAIPSWARKYQVSCYMCHSGFAARNATGEAFMNNGFRLPGGGDGAFTKQENVKLGVEDWKKSIDAPNTGSIPQFNPLSIVVNGNVISYSNQVTNSKTGASSGKAFTINAPNGLNLFYGASLGDNFTIFGQIGGLGTAVVETDETVTTIETNASHTLRAVYQIQPGLNFAIGNAFQGGTYNGYVSQATNVLPAPQTYAELTYTQGETGGYTITAGTSTGAKYNTVGYSAAINKLNDLTYVRAKVKLIGAGLLSGTGGEFGNNYNGVDNQLSIGGGLTHASTINNATTIKTSPRGFSANYLGESLVYGGDIQAAYQNVIFGFAVSKDKDLKLTNYQTAIGYFVIPSVYAKITYADIANAANIATPNLIHKPTIAPSVAWWPAPNISMTGTYTYNQRKYYDTAANLAAGANTTANTFNLAVQAAF